MTDDKNGDDIIGGLQGNDEIQGEQGNDVLMVDIVIHQAVLQLWQDHHTYDQDWLIIRTLMGPTSKDPPGMNRCYGFT